MKNKKVLPILLLAFVLLIGGSYILYDKLGINAENRQLTTDSNIHDSQEENTKNSELNPAPDFTVYDADGNEVTLSDYIGKPIVLNFWASWCPPCRSEMPNFQKKFEELGNNVQFLMINATGGRETLEDAKHFIYNQGYTFPVLFDIQSNAVSTYDTYSLPTTYFIDVNGNVITGTIGMISEEQLETGIDMIYTP